MRTIGKLSACAAAVLGGLVASAAVVGDANSEVVGRSIIKFTQDGTLRVTSPCTVEILLVGGGGGGGGIADDVTDRSALPGGGGGGGVIHKMALSLGVGEYPIVVGKGGAKNMGNVTAAAGGNTTAFGLTAYGGGCGAMSMVKATAGEGGSGGGGSKTPNASFPGRGQSADAVAAGNLGHAGADATSTYYTATTGGGGGGGAGAAAAGPKGGDGYLCCITGAEVYYGGGGSGSVADLNGLGGGAANVGGGGRCTEAGGDGVVIVSVTAGGGTGSGGGEEVVVPQVKVTHVEQDRSSRRVTIEYTLANAPAVVTLDVLTNGVSIGGANVNHVSGDCNRLVADSGTHTIYWQADKSWPGWKLDDGSVMPEVTAWATARPPDYMVVDLNDGSVSYYPAVEFLPDGGLANDAYKTERLVMRKIPAAGCDFRMGSLATDNGYQSNQPIMWVSFTEDFYLGVYEVTQAQLLKATGANPSRWSLHELSPLRPAEYMKRDELRGANLGHGWPNRNDYQAAHAVDANSYIWSFRRIVGDAILFDLPTEAQWLFACRAGTYAPFNCGYVGPNARYQADLVARYVDGVNNTYNGNLSNTSNIGTEMGTTVVGSLRPNAFGLYDMIGNVWEYVLDRYSASYTAGEADYVTVDPTGPSTVLADGANGATICGGGYNTALEALNAATRAGGKPSEYMRSFLGFRLWAPAKATR